MEYILLVVGFLLLIKGADMFVDGSISVAKKLGIPSMIIGLTIVAMGTSAPEAAVSISASLRHSAGIAVGNIVGSNIFNLFAIIGICLLFIKMPISRETIFRDFPIYIISTVILLVFSIGGTISRIDGAVMFICMVIYIYILVRDAKKNKSDTSSEEYKEVSLPKAIVFILIGAAAVVIGGDAVVKSAKSIALSLGLTEQFIGLSIVAIGTSLPELVTSLVAIKKNESDLAIGNVIGSNIFNTLFILGVASFVSPVTVSSEAFTDIIISLVLAVAAFALCFHKRRLTMPKGVFMLAVYVAFFIYILLR